MTINQKKKIEDFLTALPKRERCIYRDIAEYAIELGYTPSQEKNAHGAVIALVFTKSKVSKRLIKIHPPDVYSDETEFKIQFYAATHYSDFIHERVRREFEESGSTSCESNCSHCLGKYTYIYPDGREVYHCYMRSLLKLSPVGTEHINEIKKLMKIQVEFWLERCSK